MMVCTKTITTKKQTWKGKTKSTNKTVAKWFLNLRRCLYIVVWIFKGLFCCLAMEVVNPECPFLLGHTFCFCHRFRYCLFVGRHLLFLFNFVIVSRTLIILAAYRTGWMNVCTGRALKVHIGFCFVERHKTNINPNVSAYTHNKLWEIRHKGQECAAMICTQRNIHSYYIYIRKGRFK